MKRVPVVLASSALALSIGGLGLIARDGLFDVEGMWGVIIALIPVGLAWFGFRSAKAYRSGQLWFVSAAQGAFVVVTAFSVGPYFWPTVALSLLTALVAQFTRDPAKDERVVETTLQ